jgi:hypothetical protein
MRGLDRMYVDIFLGTHVLSPRAQPIALARRTG